MLENLANGLDPRTQEKQGRDGEGSDTLTTWRPLPGPQSYAYYSEADEVYYGGAAGGGKTDLLLGLAAREHERSFIFRRTYNQLDDLIERSKEIIGGAGTYNANTHTWRLGKGRIIRFGALQYEDDVDKWQGRARDLLAFDELPQFSLRQYLTMGGWLRTRTVGQRTRIVGAGNPPLTTEGEWVIERWAAWLDPQHSNPAKPGELRWYVRLDGEEVEVEGPAPVEWKGELKVPKSRTFIPASVDDNPFYVATGYKNQLDLLPEPLRSQLLGSFRAGMKDHPWQVIPSQWVEDAFQRWRESPEEWRRANRPFAIDPNSGIMTPAILHCVGVDVARGGRDFNVLAKRYANWFAQPERIPGEDTPNADPVAQAVLLALTEGGYANIDGIGVGASVYDLVRLAVGEKRARSILGSEAAPGPDKTGTLSFPNLRSYAWWHMREILDPRNRENVALPPDSKLKGDLCAPRWSHGLRGAQVESKADIYKRIKRSTDDGDAYVYAALTDLIYKPAEYKDGFFF